MQAGASDRGREFAARWAEMIFTLQTVGDPFRSHLRELIEELCQAEVVPATEVPSDKWCGRN